MSALNEACNTFRLAASSSKGGSAAKKFSFAVEDYLLGKEEVSESDFKNLLDVIGDRELMKFNSSAFLLAVLNTEFWLLSKKQIEELLACVVEAHYFSESPDVVIQAAADLVARNLEKKKALEFFDAANTAGNVGFSEFGSDVLRRMGLV